MPAKGEGLVRWWFIFWEECANGPVASSFLSSNVIPKHLGGSKKHWSYRKYISEIGAINQRNIQ